jgi:O-antigen/teichoic acid export membrane protein
MKNKYSSLGKNTIIFALGTMGSKSIHFFLIPFYTRIFNSYEYGQLDIIQTTINLLIPLITLQLGEAIFRFTMDKDRKEKSVFTNALMYNSGLILILCLVWIFTNQQTIFDISFFLVMSIVVIEMLLIQVMHFIRALGKIKDFVFTELLQVVLFVFFNIVFLVGLDMSIEGYFIALVCSKTIAFIFLILKCNILQYLKFSYLDKTLLKMMLVYSIPLIPNTLMWWFMNASDRYIIAYFMGLESTGIYAVSYKLPSLLVLIYGVFSYAWQIFAIEESESSDKNETFSTVFLYNSLFFIISISLLLPTLKVLMSILGSSEFYESWRYIPILLFGTMFSAFSKFFGTGYIITKRTGGAFLTSIYGGIINILISILTIPFIGLYGAAFSTMIGFLVMWILRMKQTKQIFPIKIDWFTFLTSILILVLQTVVLFINIPIILLLLIHLILIGVIIIINIRPLKLLLLLFLTKIKIYNQ